MKNQEYKKTYKKYLGLILKSNFNKKKEVQKIEADFIKNELEKRSELKKVEKQYFIENFGKVKFYLNRISCGRTTIFFSDNYYIEPFVEKRQVVTGYYKNGKPRVKMMSFGIVKISSNGSQISIEIGHTLTEARALKNRIETRIKEGEPLLKNLDKKKHTIEQEIAKLKKEKDTKISSTIKKFDKEKKEYKKKKSDLILKGSETELQYLFRSSRIVLLVFAIIIGGPLLVRMISGYANTFIAISETNYNYSIESPKKIEKDCNLSYDKKKHYFTCKDFSYSGSVNFTNNSKLYVGSEEITVEDGKFERTIPKLIIPADAWAVSNPDFKKIAKKYGNYTDTLEIYNNFTHKVVLSRPVKITWEFKKKDFTLLENTWKAWKTEQEEKAKEKLEKEIQAEEEAKKKAEEEARIAEEKRLQEEEEKRQQALREEQARKEEEARQEAERQKAAASSNSNSGPSSSSGSSGGGYSADQTMIHGYCKDGLEVYGNPHARGRANVCYGHKGWVGN